MSFTLSSGIPKKGQIFHSIRLLPWRLFHFLRTETEKRIEIYYYMINTNYGKNMKMDATFSDDWYSVHEAKVKKIYDYNKGLEKIFHMSRSISIQLHSF